MSLRLRSTLLFCFAFVLFTTGCKSSEDYSAFAKAGTAYANAIDSLLAASEQLEVDASSEKLLLDRKLATVSASSYEQVSNVDRERLAVLEKLRTQAHLLGRYFTALQALATSDAPDQVQKQLEGITTDLQGMSSDLATSRFANKAVIGGLGKMVVSARIEGALRRELHARETTIRQELALEDQLIEALSEDMQHDLKISTQAEEQRLVIEPLASGAASSNPDEWIANRRKFLLTSTDIEGLRQARSASKDMRDAFEQLLSGGLTVGQVNLLLDRLSAAAELGKSLRKDIKSR